MIHSKGKFLLRLGLILALLWALAVEAVPVGNADTPTGTRIQLPILNHIGDSDADVETWIRVQNVGVTGTGAIAFFWGAYSEQCPPDDFGAIDYACTHIPNNGPWHLEDQIPAEAKSAIVYSVDADHFQDACDAANNAVGSTDEWGQWEDNYPEAYPGEDLAVTVKRTGPGNDTPEVSVTTSYAGISGEMEGVYDPALGGYAYHAPLVYADADNGFKSWIDIQNSGDECTSVELWFTEQDDCEEAATICTIPVLAPGEAYRFDASQCVGPGFVGSAYITATQPLGIVVDRVGNDMLMSYTGVPADVPESDFTAGSVVNYAPLVVREDHGWETDITVQNLSSEVSAAVKVDFLDNSGNIITTLEDRICPRGSQSFTLPVSNNLPGHYVGAARAESQASDDVSPPNVHSVVSLVKYDGDTPVEAMTYNAFPSQLVTDVGVVAIPSVAKDAQGWTSEIAIQNVNPNPGYTDFAIFIYDETGTIVDYVCQRLNEKQVEYMDFTSWGSIHPGFVGSVVISAMHTTQDGGFALAAVGVERAGATLGDEVGGSRGFPIFEGFEVELTPECPPALPPPSPDPPTPSGARIQLPILNHIGGSDAGVETWIEVQNVGATNTKAALVLWGEAGQCLPNADGPIAVVCTGLLIPGAPWHFEGSQIPSGARSGIVYSLSAEQTDGDIFPDAVCEALYENVRGDHNEWRNFDLAFQEGSTWSDLDFGSYEGEPLAVTVKRTGPGNANPDVPVTSAYNGVSEDMEGVGPPYQYFAPRIMHGYNDLDTTITIQNSGENCTSIWLYYKEEGNCEQMLAQHIEELAPGEAVRVGPGGDVPFPSQVQAPWLGLVYIEANEPLGIIVDQVGNDMVMTYTGVPYPDVAGSLVNYAPLIFREYNGWETNVTVQNLTSQSRPAKVKVYFLDDSGDIITTLVDWVCRNGSKTFTLPVVDDLPGHDVGAVRVESQGYYEYPGTHASAQNIQSVVSLVKYSGDTPVEAMTYNAFPSQWVTGVGVVVIPSVARDTPGWISEIAIQNVNPNPGYTDFTIFFYDQNGLLGSVSRTLTRTQVAYINLDESADIPPGFEGSVVISATHTTQDGGFALAAIGVERAGATLGADIPGDELAGSQGLPIFEGLIPGSPPPLSPPIPPAPSDIRIQLPILNHIGDSDAGVETWIEVQNVGAAHTKAALVVWGEPGQCPPNANGPIAVVCTGLLAPGTAWHFESSQIPSGAKSGILYSLSAEQTDGDIFADAACEHLYETVMGDNDDWRRFDVAFQEGSTWSGFDFGSYEGEPLAVTVERAGPGDEMLAVNVSASYAGISGEMEGVYDPVNGGYTYYTPLVYADAGNGFNSWIDVQNSGDECTSVELWFRQRGDCQQPPIICQSPALAPGETYRYDVNECVRPGFVGSAWIRASQPLGVIVDQVGRDMLMSHTGVPADVPGAGFTAGSTVNYAPLIFREDQGWETGITVQNLSSEVNAKAKVEFLDNSGNIITTLEDWICPRMSKSFTLPVSGDLPGHDVGAVWVESQTWDSVSPPNVHSVVSLVKYDGDTPVEAMTYSAFPSQWVTDVGVVAFPIVAKNASGLTSEIAIQNVNPHPGYTDFTIFFYDQNGLLGSVSKTLNQKQVEYINFDDSADINPGFEGSVVISATHTTQDGGFALAAVGVERVGTALGADIPGDEAGGSQGFPIPDGLIPGSPPPPFPILPAPSDTGVQLPILNHIGDSDADVETWIEVQNVGAAHTKAALVVWGEPDECPPNANGPIAVVCGLLKPGAAWHFVDPGIPTAAKSGIVYSLSAEQTDYCAALQNVMGDDDEWRRFDVAFREGSTWSGFDFGSYEGEPLAVTVERAGPGDETPGVSVRASYAGISGEMEGVYDPALGGYAYHAPLVYADAGNGFNSWIDVQNSGHECTSVELWFKEQGECQRSTICQIPALAPGETYRYDASQCVGPGFVGSAWIRTSQPLAIVVDQVGNDMLMSYTGVPADVPESGFTAGSTVNYAPLIFREDHGWETDITVQNLSSEVSAKAKVEFLDNSGNIITTVEDWICPGRSKSFILPATCDLPGHYVGTVRVESQAWDGVSPPNIHSVVSLVKYSGDTPVEAMMYNAFPSQLVTDVGVVAIPSVAKDAQGWTSEIAIQNVNPNPGYTDFAIFIYDETGTIVDYVCERLNEKQVEYMDFNSWGSIHPGFRGSLVISATHTTQDRGFALAAIGVERAGTTLGAEIPGDEVGGSQGFPIFEGFEVELIPECPPPLPPPSPDPPAPTGTRIQLPVVDSENGRDTQIQVRNAGDEETWVAVIYWGSYSGECNSPGSLTTWHKQSLPLNGVWTLTPTDTARSAIVLSFDAEPTAQPDERTSPTGEPVAVTVKRTGPGDANPDVPVTSAYNGVSEDMEGVGPPYRYFAPHIMHGYNDLDTTITIHNSGENCTSVWINYKEEGNCEYQKAQHIEKLAPGEAIRIGPGTHADIPFPSPELDAPWLGLAYIEANEPLGIIVDQVGNDMLMTYTGMPADVAGSLVNYAPLIFREYNGWETNITVQNLTSESRPAKVKVYFLDDSGDIITTLVDWVCRNGSKTFTLPVVDDLPGHDVGAVRVESQGYRDYPDGGYVSAQNIQSVVSLVKYDGDTPVEAMTYNAFPSQWVSDVGVVAIPSVARDAPGWTSEIAIQNVNPNPGYTDFAILFYDESGLPGYVCGTLNEKQVVYINLDESSIAPGFVGSVVISAMHTTQEGGFALAAVGVERVGATLGADIPGDEVSGSGSFPILDGLDFGLVPQCDSFDTDVDGIPDDQDNCWTVASADQTDTDGDGVGDICDDDDDNDLVRDVCDNCPTVANPDQADTTDGDGDGVSDPCDNCPNNTNPNQEDGDQDGVGDACDACTDADGDGYGAGPDCTGPDCDDTNPSINPGATESCTDGIDNDCDELVDDDDPDCPSSVSGTAVSVNGLDLPSWVGLVTLAMLAVLGVALLRRRKSA